MTDHDSDDILGSVPFDRPSDAHSEQRHMELPPVIAVTVTGDVAFLDTELLHFPLGMDPDKAALDEVTKRYAAPSGRPVRVVAVDDNATVTLLVHPDGHTSDVRPLRMDDPLIDAYADRAGGLRLPEEPEESALAKLGDLGAKLTDPAKSAAAGLAASTARLRERSRAKADVRATDRANRAAAKAAKVRQRAEEKEAAQAALARTSIADEVSPKQAAPKQAAPKKTAPKKTAPKKAAPEAPIPSPKVAFRKAAPETAAAAAAGAAAEPGARAAERPPRVKLERTPRSERATPTRAHAKPTPGLAERATYVSKAAAAGFGTVVAQAGGKTKAASAGLGAKAGAVGGRTKLAAAGVVAKASTAGDKTRVAAAGFGSVAAEAGGKTKVAAAALTGKAAHAVGSPQARTAAVAIIATAALVVFAAFGITLFSGNNTQTDNSAGDSGPTAIVPETPGSNEPTTAGAAAQPTVPAPTFAQLDLVTVGAFAYPRAAAVVAFTFKAPKVVRAKLTLDPQSDGKPSISRTVELKNGQTKYLVRDVPAGKVRWQLEATNVLPLGGIINVEAPPAPPSDPTEPATDPDTTPADPDPEPNPDPPQTTSTPPPGGPVDPDDPSTSPGGPIDPDDPS